MRSIKTEKRAIRRAIFRLALVIGVLAVVLQGVMGVVWGQSQPSATTSAPGVTVSVPATTSAPASAPAPLPTALGGVADDVTASELPGMWITEVAGTRQELILRADGTFRFNKLRGTYQLRGSQILLRPPAGGRPMTWAPMSYEFEVAKTTLILRGGDLRKELKFNRQTTLAEYMGNWFEITPTQVRQKTVRVIVVFSIVIAARLIIVGLQALSAAVIYSKRGPVKYLYRYNKRRVRTLHLLGLNVIKYIIYFTALGFVLSEIGVDYTAYLASLSVVGLAIGFGSQGLVSDMVTGFFVIFEGQFDVGDMVEISGQTGVITEFGLRTTSLRNYFGQTIVIPNRNIAVVGNFGLSGQRCTLDVAIDCPEMGMQAKEAIRKVAEEVRRQFVGVIVRDPTYDGPLSLMTGECFVRIHLAIWPRQEWVIEQQLMPRIREMFARENLTIPKDRIVAFYHPHEDNKITSFTERLQRRFQWRRARPEKDNAEVKPPDDDYEL